MNIQFGSIEYFELLSFQDKLKGYTYDKFDLHHLDLLRVEVARKIGAINLTEKNRRGAKEARMDKVWGDLGNTLYEGERDGLGVMRKITITEKQLKKEILQLLIAHMTEYNVMKPEVLHLDRFIEIQASNMVYKYCQHENEKLNQGDGYVYVTCKDCGKSLEL